ENLVYFNQAKTSKDREYYFQRLSISAHGNESKQFEILRSQYNYYSNWYYVAVREVIALDDFREDPAWVVSMLRHKISKQQASEAIRHLEQLGMIKRNDAGKLVQSEPLVKYPGGIFNHVIQKFQIEMLERAKESLNDDEYAQRNASSVTLSCDHERVRDIKKCIDEFRDRITLEFGVNSKKTDSVVQVNVQIFQLTPLHKSQKNLNQENVSKER
ncbi:MAG: TIGR02147 family protein, partial [Bdellovibrionota bacterium]